MPAPGGRHLSARLERPALCPAKGQRVVYHRGPTLGGCPPRLLAEVAQLAEAGLARLHHGRDPETGEHIYLLVGI